MKSLLMLYSIQKYRTIIDILRKKLLKSSLTNDEHNMLILSSVMFNMQFDYIAELKKSVVSDIVQDLNIFKSFVYNKAKEQKLIPNDSTFTGIDNTIKTYDVPVIHQIIENVPIYDINILKMYAETTDDRFIDYFNKGLSGNDIYELIYVHLYNIVYSINSKNYTQGVQSITFFSSIFDKQGDIISLDVKHYIAEFLSTFSASVISTDEDVYEKILGISSISYNDILSGALERLDDISPEVQKLKNKGD